MIGPPVREFRMFWSWLSPEEVLAALEVDVLSCVTVACLVVEGPGKVLGDSMEMMYWLLLTLMMEGRESVTMMACRVQLARSRQRRSE